MNKAWITYLAMLAAVGAGMSAILIAGARLQAPPDLRGRWLVQWDLPAGSPAIDSLNIEQSGVFFNIRLTDGTTLRAVVHGRWKNPAGGSFAGEMSSDDGRWNLRLGTTAASELRGILTTREGRFTFSAHKEPEKPAALSAAP